MTDLVILWPVVAAIVMSICSYRIGYYRGYQAYSDDTNQTITRPQISDLRAERSE